MPLKVADVPSLPVNRMTVKCTHECDACVGTGSLRVLCCLRNEKRREQSADEKCRANDPVPTMLHDRTSCQGDLSVPNPLTHRGNPSEAEQAICDTDSSKSAI